LEDEKQGFLSSRGHNAAGGSWFASMEASAADQTMDDPALNSLVRNAQYKLCGGAQLERLLAEFEIVAHCQEFPKTSDDEVAVTIGLNSLHTIPDYDRGASDLAQKKSRSIFTPLIDVLLNRCRYLMRNMFSMVVQHMLTQDSLVKQQQQSQKENASDEHPYAAFFDELQTVADKFLDKLLVDIKNKTNCEFDTFTKIMDWDFIDWTSNSSNGAHPSAVPTSTSAELPADKMNLVDEPQQQAAQPLLLAPSSANSAAKPIEQGSKLKEEIARLEKVLLNPTAQDTLQRVQKMTMEQCDKNNFFANDRSRELTADRCKKIKLVAARLFAGVRWLFVKYIRAKYHAFFVHPLFTQLDTHVRLHFQQMDVDQLKELLGMRVASVKELLAKDEVIVQKVSAHVDTCQQILAHIQQQSAINKINKK